MIRAAALVAGFVLCLSVATAATTEETGFIGVMLKPDENDPKKAEVAEVVADGPADKAGVKAGDVITKVDGKGFDDLQGLIKKVQATKPGDTITLTVTRDGKEKEIKVKVGKKE